MILQPEAVLGALSLLYRVHSRSIGEVIPAGVFHLKEPGKLKLLQSGGAITIEGMKRIQESEPGSYVLVIVHGRTCTSEEEYEKAQSCEEFEDRVSCLGIGEESFLLSCTVKKGGHLGRPQFVHLPSIDDVEIYNGGTDN